MVASAQHDLVPRAAFDLARWAPSLTERVTAVDTLAYSCEVDIDAVWALLAARGYV